MRPRTKTPNHTRAMARTCRFAVGARAARLHPWLNDRYEEWTLKSVQFLTRPHLNIFFSEHGCTCAR